ncbi:MAG: hypothetical protein DRP85_09370 [Candidatus Makaraimicrobium thalassicum]|nr:MAG: hypothetical protein DRP85_09370 [Candidatus Omnitrophota bacterium]
MRIISAELAKAMREGAPPYLVCEVYTDTLFAEYTPIAYDLRATTLTITLPGIVPTSTTLKPTKVVLKRGTVINRTNVTISTSKFTVMEGFVAQMPNGQYETTLTAHLIPPRYASFPADGTYEETINLFADAIGATASLRSPTADFWQNQFLPDNQILTYADANSFLRLLKKKHLIYAADNGGEDILFYSAIELPPSIDYNHNDSSTPYIGIGYLTRRRYMAQNEFNEPRVEGLAIDPPHNLGFVAAIDSMPTNTIQPALFKALKVRADLKFQNGDYLTWNDGQATIYPLEAREILKRGATPAWRTEIRQAEFFTHISSTNPLRILSQLPTSGENGEQIYNVSNDTFYVWVNVQWVPFAEGDFSVYARLLENGDFRLLENGDIRLQG